jgi:hypothetical protein
VRADSLTLRAEEAAILLPSLSSPLRLKIPGESEMNSGKAETAAETRRDGARYSLQPVD